MPRKRAEKTKYEYPLNLLRDICKEQGKEELPTEIAPEISNNHLQIVNDLPDYKKELIQLRYAEEKTFPDIAKQHGVIKSAVHSHLKRLLILLGTKRQYNTIFWTKKSLSRFIP